MSALAIPAVEERKSDEDHGKAATLAWLEERALTKEAVEIGRGLVSFPRKQTKHSQPAAQTAGTMLFLAPELRTQLLILSGVLAMSVQRIDEVTEVRDS